jgi:tetratricopeptide (TPR) repeat protein
LSDDPRAVVEQSTRLMVAGMEWIDRSDWRKAADCFLEAGRLRELLPWREDVECAWMFAAAWLNFGDMLLRIGDPELLPDAVVSFDKVIAAMAHVPLEGKPEHAERLALTRLNRAGAWTDQGEWAAAMEDFEEAERVLGIWGEEATPVSRFLSAMLQVNRGRLKIQMQEAIPALDDIAAALEKLKPLTLTGEIAQAHIQAWSLRCRALALLLDEPGGAEKVGDWIAEATDSAEEALKWIRASGFRDTWVTDLVRYGAKIYQACQPHFLGEFLIEWLGPRGPLKDDAALKREMFNLMLVAQIEVERLVLKHAHENEFVESQTRVLRSLQRAMAVIS